MAAAVAPDARRHRGGRSRAVRIRVHSRRRSAGRRSRPSASSSCRTRSRGMFTPGVARNCARAWTRGKRVLLTVGRMAPGERYKGHDRSSPSFRALRGRGHDVVYLIIGEGDDRARLEACSETRGRRAASAFSGAGDRTRRPLSHGRSLRDAARPAKASGSPFWKRWRAALPALGGIGGGARTPWPKAGVGDRRRSGRGRCARRRHRALAARGQARCGRSVEARRRAGLLPLRRADSRRLHDASRCMV